MWNDETSDTYGYLSTFKTFRKIAQAAKHAAGLSVNGYRILARASHAVNAAPVDMARSMGVARSAVTMELDTLEGKNLVRRIRNEGNSRMASIEVSPLGCRAIEQMESAVEEIRSSAMEKLPAKNQAVTNELMLLMADNMGSLRLSSEGLNQAFMYVEVCSRHKQIFTQAAHKFDFSINEAIVMSALVDSSPKVRQRDLVHWLGMQRATVSACCSSLEARGMLVCSSDTLDKRGKRVEPTKDGRRHFAAMKAAYQMRYLTEIREFNEDERNFISSQNACLAKSIMQA